MADQFFVSLFSNSSMSIFPGNTLSKFRVKLSQTLRFHDDWDVALAELSLPFAIQNIKQGMNVVSLLKAEDNGQLLGEQELSLAPNQSVIQPLNAVLSRLTGQTDCLAFHRDHFALTVKRGIAIEFSENLAKLLGVPKKFHGSDVAIRGGIAAFPSLELQAKVTAHRFLMSQVNFSIRTGYYESASDLVNVINEACTEAAQHKLLNYSPYTKTVSLELFIEGCVLMHSELSYMLGFGEQTAFNAFTQAERDVSLFPSLQYLFVYTDIVEEEHVADTKAPLLRLLPMRTVNRNELLSYSFQKYFYKKCSRREIGVISIELVNEGGEPLPFIAGSGRVSVVLHFKRKQCTT